MKPQPVANKLTERVMVRLDGREWQLIVTHNVLCDLEAMTGQNALFDAGAFLNKPSATTVRALLYLCLREQGAKYTLEETGKLITPETLTAVANGLLMAWVNSMPKQEDTEGEAGKLKAVV